ncbi:unnamed protein product [Effrenium voratum]|nr:unnamed protein product [Effrenium voratum]
MEALPGVEDATEQRQGGGFAGGLEISEKVSLTHGESTPKIAGWARADGQKPRALVVHPRLPGEKEHLVPWDAAEAVALARAVGWTVSSAPGAEESSDDEDEIGSDNSDAEEEEESEDRVEAYIARLERVDPKFYFHMKELTRICVLVAQQRADLLFVNAALSPVQQRHLEVAMDLAWRAARGGKDAAKSLGSVAVFDRNRTVLAIFARKASSSMARLSIELAEAQEVKAKLGTGAVQGVAAQMQKLADVLARKVPGCSKAALLARSGGAKGARDQTSE